MKQRQFQDHTAQQNREEIHQKAVDFERSLKDGVIDSKLAKKYIEDNVIDQIFLAGYNFAKAFSNNGYDCLEMWKKTRKA